MRLWHPPPHAYMWRKVEALLKGSVGRGISLHILDLDRKMKKIRNKTQQTKKPNHRKQFKRSIPEGRMPNECGQCGEVTFETLTTPFLPSFPHLLHPPTDGEFHCSAWCSCTSLGFIPSYSSLSPVRLILTTLPIMVITFLLWPSFMFSLCSLKGQTFQVSEWK